jgi:hypothetical protein
MGARAIQRHIDLTATRRIPVDMAMYTVPSGPSPQPGLCRETQPPYARDDGGRHGGAGAVNTTISSPRVVAATLDTWTAHDWNRGVLLRQLAPQDQIIVRTRNTTYEIIVVEPHAASVLIRGGAYFPTLTPARVAGSSLGGGCLKLHGIYAGFQMELITDDLLRVLTTRVRTVSVLPTPAGTVM